MTIPKISIIIPVYNVEAYIGYTIDSILNQTLNDIEIILIDDGSTDNSKEIIQDYSSKYKNITLLYQQNSGPSKARNRGIEKARGEYIVFVDSDDLLPEDSLEIRYKTAINNNADIVIGGTHKFNSEKQWPMKNHFLGDGEKDIRNDSSILWTVGPCNKIFKKELIKDIRFPENIKYAEDQVFVLEAYLRAKKIYTIDYPIYLYRMRETEINESLSQQIYNNSSYVINQILDVWNISCKNIEKYIKDEFIVEKIKINYMERLATADIWPALKSAIMSNNDKLQEDSLKYFIKIIGCISDNVLKQQEKIKWIIHRLTTYKYLFIKEINYTLLSDLLNIVCEKLDDSDIYDIYTIKNNKTNKLFFNENANKQKEVLSLTIFIINISFRSMEQNISNEFILNSVKSKYIESIVSDYMLLAIKSGLISKDLKFQENTLKQCISFIDDINEYILSNEDNLIWIMTKGITDKYLFINRKNKKLVIKLADKVFKKIDTVSMYRLKKQYGYYVSCMNRAINTKSNIFIYEFLIIRRLDRIKNEIKNKINNIIIKLCTRGVFEIFKLLPVKRNSIVLATNRSHNLEGNLKFIINKLKHYKNLEVNLYLKSNELKKIDLIKMYSNFARAKFIILDDYYKQIYGYNFKKKTEIIQVWHACGAFKKFGMSAIGKGDSNSEVFEKNAHGHYTTVITSSSSINKHYADAFNINLDKVISLGVPRTDTILNKDYNKFIRVKLEKMYPQIKGKKIITYAPTFRGNPKQRKNFKSRLNCNKILDNLSDEYVIILKLHPVVNSKSIKIEDKYKDRILNLTDYKEINDILIITDFLISDYSSVIFEYCLLDRPMIFFAYDLDEYINERDFYYEYEELVPGPIVKTNDEIIELIKNNEFDLNKIKKFKEVFFENIDTNSTERFIKFILDKINESK